MPRADRRTALFGTALVVLAALLLAAIRAVSTGSVQTAHMTHEYIPALNADGMMDRAALAELKGAVLVKDIEIAHAESLPQSADGLEQKVRLANLTQTNSSLCARPGSAQRPCA